MLSVCLGGGGGQDPKKPLLKGELMPSLLSKPHAAKGEASFDQAWTLCLT